MRTCTRRSAFALGLRAAFSLGMLGASAAAGVLVVDASGGGEYTSLVDALAAAQDGDTLLVRPGDYTGFFQPDFVITDRSLTIAGDGTGEVQVGALKVVQPTPGKRVVLRGLTATKPLSTGLFEGLSVQGGEVLAEDCHFMGRTGITAIGGTPGSPGARVDAGHLVLVRCTVEGGRGQDTHLFVSNPTRGGFGLQCFARASVYGSTLIGGEGGDQVTASPAPGGAGGAGVSATNGLVFLAGSTVIGGQGGDGEQLSGSPTDYSGGDAVHLNQACDLQLLDVTLVPGAGGQMPDNLTGIPGDTVDGPFSTVSTHPGPYRSYAIGDPTPEGGTLQLDYAGVQGDVLLIFVSPLPGTLPLPGKQGVWHLGAPLFGPWLFGPLAAPSGTLSLSIPVPGAGLGPDGALLLYEQVFVKPASGPPLLSSPTTHLIVDGSL